MQTNTKILAREFEYFAPKTLDEALDLLEQYRDKNIKILAGGTDLLVKMKTTDLDVDYLMNVKEIAALNFIDTQQGLSIGATIPLAHIIREVKVKIQYTALYEGIKAIAAPAVRNMGTIAGNIGNASPAADTVPPLIAYQAEVVLQSKRAKRKVLLEDLMIGVGKTTIEPDELITQINIPDTKPHTGSVFLKKSRVKADLAKINLAVCIQRDGHLCHNCKIVFGSVAVKAVRARKTEKLLEGQPVTPELISQVAQNVASEIKPIDDIRSTAAYRRAMSQEMLKEALRLAWTRTNNKSQLHQEDGGE